MIKILLVTAILIMLFLTVPLDRQVLAQKGKISQPAKPLSEEEKIKKTLIPKTLIVKVWVKGEGTFHPFSNQTVTWKIDRFYIASTRLNAVSFMASYTKEGGWKTLEQYEAMVRKHQEKPLYYTRWYIDQKQPGSLSEIATQVTVNDSMQKIVDQQVFSQDKNKENPPKLQTTTETLTCNDFVYAWAIANFTLEDTKQFVQIEFPLAGFKQVVEPCDYKKTIRGSLNPASNVDIGFKTFHPHLPGAKGFPSFTDLELPLNGREHKDVRKSFFFDTGELDSEEEFYGDPDSKKKVKIRAVYELTNK